MKFQVQKPNQEIREALLSRINNKTKPLGSLGMLEEVALKVGLIQQTLTPQLNNPSLVVFAGDHGIANAGVSPYPQAVTGQMVLNFLAGGAAINVFTKQNNLRMFVVDSGVNSDFAPAAGLISLKIGLGTNNFLEKPAMTIEQCELAIQRGAELVKEQISKDANLIGFGEMGIGNTSSATCIMSTICNLEVKDCVGRGAGMDNEGLIKKTKLLEQAIQLHQIDRNSPIEVLATFGGFEIAMMVGAMLQAAEDESVLLIDGFITTSALLVAAVIEPNILEYCIFTHCSDESGHKTLLRHLDAKPLLNLGLRLGEGTGAALAYPLIQSSINFLNQMASFESANVSTKTSA